MKARRFFRNLISSPFKLLVLCFIAVLPHTPSAGSIPEILVTTSRDVYDGTIEQIDFQWHEMGRLINTLERDVEMIDDAVKLCKNRAKEDFLECEIDVLEAVVEGEKDCSDLLDQWDAFQLNAELSVDVRIMGGSISISTASPGDRNQACAASLNSQKELELKRCELNYEERVNQQCNFF